MTSCRQKHLKSSRAIDQEQPYLHGYGKMRLIKQNIMEKDGSGSATLLPEEPEDMVGQSVSDTCHTLT